LLSEEAKHLQELFTPVGEALVTFSCLLAVGVGCVLEPFLEEIFVFLEDEILSENGVGFVETLVGQSFSECFADASQIWKISIVNLMNYGISSSKQAISGNPEIRLSPVHAFSPIGSATKLRCFCDVLDMFEQLIVII
jgi:hypothetical protein